MMERCPVIRDDDPLFESLQGGRERTLLGIPLSGFNVFFLRFSAQTSLSRPVLPIPPPKFYCHAPIGLLSESRDNMSA